MRISRPPSPMVRYRWELEYILNGGFVEVGEGSQQMPGIAALLKVKAHGSFRLTDGLWHCFRIVDPVKAAARDRQSQIIFVL